MAILNFWPEITPSEKIEDQSPWKNWLGRKFETVFCYMILFKILEIIFRVCFRNLHLSIWFCYWNERYILYLSLYTCPLHFHSGPSKVRFESPRTPKVRPPSPQVAESEEKDASPERILSSITPWSEHSQSLSVSDKQSPSGSPTPGTTGMHIVNESSHQCYVILTNYPSSL